MEKSFWTQLKSVFKEFGVPVEAQEEKTVTNGLSPIAMFCSKLEAAIAPYGGEQLPEGHPIHALKALYKEMSDFVSSSAPAEEAPAEGEAAEEEKPAGDETPKEEAAEEAAEEKPESEEGGDKKNPLGKSAEVSKREVELSKRLEEVEKALHDERETRALESHQQALRKFAHVAANPETDAPVFKRLAETDKATYDRVMELLSAADAALTLNKGLTNEIGSSLPGDSQSGASAWAAIETEAQTLMKADSTVTKARAIDIVMKKRPDLVKRHYSETAAQ